MSGNRWTLKLDGSALFDKALIGGKAWSIARMLSLGLKVPPAFVITTNTCAAYQSDGLPTGLSEEVAAGLRWIEAELDRTFGRGPAPLLLSVRSGAAVSMPGMMDTVLNLGMTQAVEAALADETGLPTFARDTHRRFLELYSSIVLRCSQELDSQHDPVAWRAAISAACGGEVPEEPQTQLTKAVKAVFDSWNSRRARKYRQHNGIEDSLGTAVTIQAMVFGNLDERSGTGVLFSRNPLTGEPEPFGEYLPKAQGEDVVSGKFTPLRLDAMREYVPAAYRELLEAAQILEQDSRDMQDIEFTVQRGQLYLLQARAGKRAPAASARIAVDLVDEGLISKKEAVARVTADQARELLRPQLVNGATNGINLLAEGEGACPGIASGIVVTSSDEAESQAQAGHDVILVRQTTSPDDVHGMIAARAIITAQGGATSHAAVVSRALGRPCVVGCGDDVLALAGRTVTIDGSGRVWAGKLETIVPAAENHPHLRRLTDWAAELGDHRFQLSSEVACISEEARVDG